LATGRFVEDVYPAIIIAPAESTATLDGRSEPFPPKYVEYERDDPSGEILVRNALNAPGYVP
jgi:hypothetical protein